MGARILNYLQDVREFYHALGVGGLEEYIYNVRGLEPYCWAPKDSIRYSAPVVGPLKGPIYNSGTKLGSQNRRTALVAPKRKIYNLGSGSEPIDYHPKMTLVTSFLH